jgi:Pentapeptide repeats (9 copies)
LLEYRGIMATSTAAVDLWDGAQGPQIKPAPVCKTWRHDQDPTRRRATFGVLYPLAEVVIDKSDDLHAKLPARFEKTKRRSVPGVRLRLLAPKIFSDTDFRECQFRWQQNPEKSEILGSSFKICSFSRCLLGGILFSHVTFEDCTFNRCDFAGSKFDECQFVNCIFTECTAENASFVVTEIDPTAFLKGMPPPVFNYENPVPEGEQNTAQVEADWVEVRRKLAAQLLRSNTEIHHSLNSDRGLFELKRAELASRVQALQPHSMEGAVRLPMRAIQVALAWLVLHATKGGTSLSRLVLAATLAILTYAYLLSHSHVAFQGQDCNLNAFAPSLVMQQLARAMSLFLAMGYTDFSGGPVATVLLTAAASLGLFWYALVAEVVIHRVYR